MRTSFFSQQLTLAGLVFFALTAPVLAGKPTKPGGGGSTTPPPVKYQTIWLGKLDGEVLAISAINDNGLIVGRTTGSSLPSRAFYSGVSPAAGTVVYPTDVNTLANVWVDLATGQQETDWTARSANDVNDDGWIVGGAEHTSGLHRPYIYAPDLRAPDLNTAPWTFQLLPSTPGYRMTATGINNLGQVVGVRWLDYATSDDRKVFAWDCLDPVVTTELPIPVIPGSSSPQVNDGGVVVAGGAALPPRVSYRYELATGRLDALYDVRLSHGCINSAGQIAGERSAPSKRGANDVEIITFSDPGLLDVEVVQPPGSNYQSAFAVNNAGTVLWRNGAGTALYLAHSGATYDVAQLASEAIGYDGRHAVLSGATSETDPEGTGFGIVASSQWSGPLFVLIPRKP